MKTYLGLLAYGLVIVTGCESKSPPGGPGATTKPPIVGQANNSFKLEVPTLATTVKQGETKTIAIKIARGTNFDQDVKLSFSEPPKGVNISPASPVLKAGDKETDVSVEAANDAALGTHEITVTGTPAKSGDATSTTVKIDVKKS